MRDVPPPRLFHLQMLARDLGHIQKDLHTLDIDDSPILHLMHDVAAQMKKEEAAYRARA